MANTVFNPYKYCNRIAINGSTLKSGEVLVPHWLQDGYKLSSEEKKRCTTFHFGEFKFHIGFIPIRIEGFETYMQGFNEEINKYVREHREGRCVIGHKPNGEPICCPKANRCTGCQKHYDDSVERYNPFKDKYQILSLDFCYEDENFDVTDENAVSPEDAVITAEETPEADKYTAVIAHFEKENPRYATIIKLSWQNVPIEKICDAIGLKPSRGREEINNAYNALCDYLNLSAYKSKKKSR